MLDFLIEQLLLMINREVRRNVESNRVGTSPTSGIGHMRFQSWFKLADLCTVLTNARASLIKAHVPFN